jgi:hypothetical protein
MAYNIIVNDFNRVWDSLVAKETGTVHQGTMFLTFMAMNLLELVCRLCKSDEQALMDFSKCLYEVERKYFIHLPIMGHHIKQGNNWFTLPYMNDGQRNDDLLLTYLFETVRHGLGHQYQPRIAIVKGERQFYVTLAGASGKRRRRKRSFHLNCRVAKNRDISMLVCPDVLIDDIDEAVKTADLFNRNLTIDDHMEIKRSNIDIGDIEKVLADEGVLLRHSIY